MSMRSPLAHVRGLGSAKEGTHHFWWQRVTAIALVPLTIWFVAIVIAVIGADYETARATIAHPVSAAMMLAFIAATFHHAQSGLQVVIEDYIHIEWLKITLLLTVKFLAVIFGLLSALAVVRIAVGG
ncbi:MAG: succinate dehydrogenase, hydrophobic membrane anchor protein [Pseudomonadota bacterium]